MIIPHLVTYSCISLLDDNRKLCNSIVVDIDVSKPDIAQTLLEAAKEDAKKKVGHFLRDMVAIEHVNYLISAQADTNFVDLHK